jgi:hypothetical protein
LSLDIERMYQCLHDFDFATLFVNELNWSLPVNQKSMTIDSEHSRIEIARVNGVPIFEVQATNGKVPDSQKRDSLYQELSSLFPKCLLIFLDKERIQSIWYWMALENGMTYKHEYVYSKGQPEDVFFHMLNTIISDLTVSEEKGSNRDKVEKMRLSGSFLKAFEAQKQQFAKQICGIEDNEEHELYATILLNRLILLYFLQWRGFLDNGDTAYLEGKLRSSTSNAYYREFLCLLFFEGVAKPRPKRSKEILELLGNVPYLDGDLFLPHIIERKNSQIEISNSAFEQLFSFFSQYDWRVIDIPGTKDNEISPYVFGAIFEMYFNQMSISSAQQSHNNTYSTPYEITEYLCRQTIHSLILDSVNQERMVRGRKCFTSMNEMFDRLDPALCSHLLKEILPNLSVLDPACGSGAFLVAALNTLALIYIELINKIRTFEDGELTKWLQDVSLLHPNHTYTLKKMIIKNNLFGVDIVKEAVEITRLRLYLASISTIESADALEPLPSLNVNLHVGNSLIGLLHLQDFKSLPTNLFVSSDQQATSDANVAHLHSEDFNSLDKSLLAQFDELYQKYGRRVLKSSQQGVQTVSVPSIEAIEHLAPFHWCKTFDHTMNDRGGFDIILTSPPWEVLKPDSSNTSYYESLFFQYAPQYTYQNFRIRNRRQRTSINLYKLFVEQSYNLLRKGGYCGIVVPSSICNDEDAVGLRELIFTKTQITGLISFENRRYILENIHPGFQFALLTYIKDKFTTRFPSAFSRQVIEELDHFPAQDALYLSIDFIRRFSPETLSISNFRNQDDVSICEKMLHFPRLGGDFSESWNLKVTAGVSLAPISRLNLIAPEQEGWPLYEGKMIHQYTSTLAAPRYRLAKKQPSRQEQRTVSHIEGVQKQWQTTGYHGYHLCFRSIASSLNERTLIATILPSNTWVNETINFIASSTDADTLLFLTAIFNSFMADFFVKLLASYRLSASIISQLAVPHPTKKDSAFFSIVKRAARLICISEDFKHLWEGAIESPWLLEAAAKSFAEREQLRAELDGLIAHLYHVTEDEFIAVLNTFPLVPEPVKVAAQNAYRDVERGLIV